MAGIVGPVLPVDAVPVSDWNDGADGYWYFEGSNPEVYVQDGDCWDSTVTGTAFDVTITVSASDPTDSISDLLECAYPEGAIGNGVDNYEFLLHIHWLANDRDNRRPFRCLDARTSVVGDGEPRIELWDEFPEELVQSESEELLGGDHLFRNENGFGVDVIVVPPDLTVANGADPSLSWVITLSVDPTCPRGFGDFDLSHYLERVEEEALPDTL